ncbi:dihydrofolate reductase family protein [Shimia thalassica]|uniref:dihydrofolate reductase family protein n=1 Tax=Shimia thalassica TaxID=1715693 RepID=UPI0026E378C1|nr:dihydrofolate reductase family protein [Shimia thalassica]MDO6484524.1 dihydrofolate reductase family protein [Shimia thalassica]MDO6797716.1 dihydrofolate reductase family protein [Shimia thalassica]
MSTRPTYVGYIAMSLDGFIADTSGSVDWLDPFNAALGDDGDYGTFISDIDALIMGRPTYQQVMGWGWPYENRAGYVLTHRTDFTGDHIAAAGSIETLRTAIEAKEHRHIWIMGGGETQRAALDANMFDTLSVFIMPTLLGRGLPCFGAGLQHNLTLTASTQKPGGILKLDYAIKD